MNNSVENVENSQLSTGIRRLSTGGCPVENFLIWPAEIPSGVKFSPGNGSVAVLGLWEENGGKSSVFPGKPCQSPFRHGIRPQKFVKKCQTFPDGQMTAPENPGMYVSACAGNTSFVPLGNTA